MQLAISVDRSNGMRLWVNITNGKITFTSLIQVFESTDTDYEQVLSKLKKEHPNEIFHILKITFESLMIINEDQH